MMKSEQGCPSRQISAQSAIEFLKRIWLELLDWGAIAVNSAGRFFTALFNFVMLAIAALVAALAAIVLLLREHIMKPSEASTLSLISIKTALSGKRAPVSH